MALSEFNTAFPLSFHMISHAAMRLSSIGMSLIIVASPMHRFIQSARISFIIGFMVLLQTLLHIGAGVPLPGSGSSKGSLFS